MTCQLVTKKGLNILEKLPLSVAIISFNEERIIGKMLESISCIASEIIVVDSNSTDKTPEIAKGFGAKVFTEDWKGHIAQKNSALKKCSQEWILSLDCDEVPDETMIENIKNIIQTNKIGAYYLNRKTFYLDKLLQHAWQPDWNLRLVHSSTDPIWKGRNPHDKLFCNQKASRLEGDLLHYSYTGLLHHFSKLVNYAKISAESYRKSGKKFKKRKMILNPFVAFIRQFIFRNAWKDGLHGFIVAFSTLISTFLKYAFLWEIEKKEK